MSFVLTEDQDFEVPVTINVPRNGRTAKENIYARFNLVSTDEFEADLDSGMSARDILEKNLRSWRGFFDIKGQSIEYNDENRSHALNLPYVVSGLFEAFTAGVNGRKRKN